MSSQLDTKEKGLELLAYTRFLTDALEFHVRLQGSELKSVTLACRQCVILHRLHVGH